MSENNNIVSDSYVESFFSTDVSAPTEDNPPVIKEESDEPASPSFKIEKTDSPLSELLGAPLEEEEEEDTPPIGTPPAAKPIESKTPSATGGFDINSALEDLIKEGELFGFEDGFEVKSVKDLKELLTANKQEWKREAIEEELETVFESMPNELQYALDYVRNGGTDMKTLFKVLSQTQEVKELTVEKHGQEIVRQYLQRTEFGTPEEIQAQIEEWEDLNAITKKAEIFKPKLDKLNEKEIQKELQKQEEIKKYHQQLVKSYYDGVGEALKDKNINGITLNKEEVNTLYAALTENSYVSKRSGQPLNLLGKVLEDITWNEPNYKMLAELTLFVKDPEAYKEKIRTSVKESEAASTVRKLKTSQGSLKSTTEDRDDNPTFTVPKKTISRNSMLRK